MTKKTDISSTEKLLDFIRSETPEDLEKIRQARENQDDPEFDLELKVDDAKLQEPPVTLSSEGDPNLEITSDIDTEPSNKESLPSDNTSPLVMEMPEDEDADHIEILSNSSETLLDQISIKENDDVPPPPTVAEIKKAAAKKPGFLTSISDRFGITKIGIDIQSAGIVLSKVLIRKKQLTLLECQKISYDISAANLEELYKDQTFKGFLSHTLASFCGKKNTEIWCSFERTPFLLHNITIVKVPDKDLPTAVFWSVKREHEFDEKTTLFDFSILKEFEEGGQKKLQVLVTLVPKIDVAAIKEIFQRIGYPLTGFTFQSAAIGGILNAAMAYTADQSVVFFVLHKNSSFIDLYHQEKIIFSREIKTGEGSFTEALLDHAASKDIILDDNSARDYIFAPTQQEHNIESRHAGVDAQINSMLDFSELPVIDRLIRQLNRTFEYCGTHFKVPNVARLFTAGKHVPNQALLKEIQERLGIECLILNSMYENIFTSIRPHVVAGADTVSAVGLALCSKKKTNNFLFTYADKVRQKYENMTNRIIAITTIALAILLGSVFFFQYKAVEVNRTLVSSLMAELEQKYKEFPRSQSSAYPLSAIQKIQTFNKENIKTFSRYQVLAVINELAEQVPDAIQLIDLSFLQFPASKQNEAPAGTIIIKGFITASKQEQEFILLNFINKFTKLTLIHKPALQTTEQTQNGEDDILKFTILLRTKEALL